MKILFFYQYFGTPKGSWSTRVYELTRRWVRAGHEVTVITSPYEKSDIQADGLISRQYIEGVQVIVINLADSNRLSVIIRAIRAILFALFCCYYALVLPYDRLISSSGPITVGLPLLVGRYLRSKKCFFEVRDLWPAGGIEMGLIRNPLLQKVALAFEKLFYRSSSVVVTASPGQQSHILDRFPDLQTLVIPNASDLELFGTKPDRVCLPEWTKGKHIFTHIGSLGLIHHVGFWISVAECLAKNHAEDEVILVMIGEGAQRQELESRCESLGLANVAFLGLMPKSSLPGWVQASVATLFATLDNPVQNACSPNKIFDSFAAGVPIVQTTTGWIYDLVEQEQCGLNVSLYDAQAAAAAMVALANQPEKRRKLGDNARRLAETTFDRDRLSEVYISALTAC